MLKQLLILAITLFHLHIHAKSMLVDPLNPLSNQTLIRGFLNEAIHIIKEQPDTINDVNEDGYTLLQQALINQAHIENKISQMEHTNGSEQDMLNDSIMIIRVLLNNGADPNIPFPQSRKKQHFLIKATTDSSQPRFPLHIIELLFVYGLDTEARDPKGNTALMNLIALSYVWKEMPEYRQQFIELFVRYTNNIDAQNNSKETALHRTTTFNDLQTADLLIQNGARLDIRNAQGDTPEETAKFMAGSMPSYKADRRWYWHFSFFSKSHKMIKLLQEAKERSQSITNGSPHKEDSQNLTHTETVTNPSTLSCERTLHEQRINGGPEK